MIEVRHLHYFVAVAEAMSFRKAADHLKMTQPPLSQQIQQLEIELGFQLFHRHGRTISLTVAGEVFLLESQRILRSLDQGVQHAQRAARGLVGQLHIGFVESAAYRLLPAILRRYRTQYSEVAVTLSSMTSSEQLEALAEGRIDIGFCRVTSDYVSSAVQTENVLWEPLCIVLPRDHLLAQRDTLALGNLADEGFILFPQHLGETLFHQIIQLCQDTGFTPRIAQEATQMTTIVGLVAAGLGVSVLPVSVAELPHSGVRYMMLPEQVFVPMSVVWRAEKTPPALQNLLHTIRSYSGSG
jgi:DNA-binding transcriptional LysR family regulator